MLWGSAAAQPAAPVLLTPPRGAEPCWHSRLHAGAAKWVTAVPSWQTDACGALNASCAGKSTRQPPVQAEPSGLGLDVRITPRSPPCAAQSCTMGSKGEGTNSCLQPHGVCCVCVCLGAPSCGLPLLAQARQLSETQSILHESCSSQGRPRTQRGTSWLAAGPGFAIAWAVR